ncbi:MAG: ABC transporter ATP-binding protein [Rhodospirillales bacterium]|nr:ABC transporter ATP-binding protein [Rhodospirillales bacterium]
MSSVTLQGVSKSYGAVAALRTMDLEIAQGEFLTLLGPSGCGKTTTLRLVAGFIAPSSGRILFGGDDVTDLPVQKREIGMVFQDYALFPHMTIADNIGFGLVERGRRPAEIASKVNELIQLIRLPGVENRFPAELSGGQQQRVAVARAVAHSPRVLLMDEPLGALDLKLREAMQAEISAIQRALKITTVYVTHDQSEAMSMSDRIAVMNDGVVEQLGSATEIYNRPASRFVASFVGQINLVEGDFAGIEGAWAAVSVGGTKVHVAAPEWIAGRVTIGVRPEQLSIRPAEGSLPAGTNALPGTVRSSMFAGHIFKVEIDAGTAAPIVVETHPNAPVPAVGARVRVAWNAPNAVVLAS